MHDPKHVSHQPIPATYNGYVEGRPRRERIWLDWKDASNVALKSLADHAIHALPTKIWLDVHILMIKLGLYKTNDKWADSFIHQPDYTKDGSKNLPRTVANSLPY